MTTLNMKVDEKFWDEFFSFLMCYTVSFIIDEKYPVSIEKIASLSMIWFYSNRVELQILIFNTCKSNKDQFCTISV